MKITYFGSAFNPPTLSHAAAITYLAGIYDEVLVGPSAAHAFGKTMPPFKRRMSLVAEMLKTIPAGNVALTNIEESLMEDDSAVYSYTVLKALRSIYPLATIHLAVGPDNADPTVWEKFYKHRDILKHFGRAIIPDMGLTRSTKVREMITRGTTVEALTPFVGEGVAKMLLI